MFEFSHSFFRFPDEIGTRLDVLYNDKIYDTIFAEIENSPIDFVPLSEAADFLKDSRNPLHNPKEEFFYAEIGKIDNIRGKLNPVKMIGEEATSSRVRRVMYKDNIVVSTTRPTRKAIALVPAKYDNQICSTGFAVLKPKTNILPEFLFFALRTDISAVQFEKFCTGSGYPAINQENDLPRLLIPILDETLQKSLLSIVRKIQFKALKFEALSKKAQKEAKIYFEENLNVPYESSDEKNYFHKSGSEKRTISFYSFAENLNNRLNYLSYNPKLDVIDKLKVEYSTTSLDAILREPIKRGTQPKYDENGSFKVIKTVDVTDEGINLEQCLSVENEFFENSRDYHVRKGDILIASTGIGSMGKVAIYNDDSPAMCDGHVSIIRVQDDYHHEFVSHYLRSHYGQVQIEGCFTGSSGQIELQPGDIGRIVLPDNTARGIPLSNQVVITNNMNEKLINYYKNKNKSREKWIEADKTFEDYVLGKINLT